MSTEQVKNQQNAQNTKAGGLWADISSDQDQVQSQKSESQDEHVQSNKQQQQQKTNNQSGNQDNNKKDKAQNKIKSFDPKKHMRGGFANMKTVKGGFKPEKLQKKKFQLDAVRNPFDLGDQQSQDQQQPQTKQNIQTQNQTEPTKQQNKKLSKKQQQKKQRQQIQAAFKQFGLQNKNDTEGQKKKKKKKPKKPEESKPITEQSAIVQAPVETQPAQDFQVDKQKLEEIIKQKAKKVEPKKNSKATVANAALRAKQQRQAKNKQKKIYVDL